jgi:hypothetical protein
MADRPASGISQRVGRGPTVFVFFSNRLGCVGSLFISLAATIVLIFLLRLL